MYQTAYLVLLVLLIAFVKVLLFHSIENFKCTKVDMRMVIPPPFDPFQGASKMMKQSYIYNQSNKDFEELITTSIQFEYDSTEFLNIPDKEVAAKIRDQVAVAFLDKNPLILGSGHQYIFSMIDKCATDYKRIYAVVYIIVHVPSTAYGKAVKVQADISIMDNKIIKMSATLYGNVAAADIAQLSSLSS